MNIYDVTIIGGGIVGVSTAWQLQQRDPSCRILLLEKESQLSLHQTGRNSGVIHAGVYYEPGSLKAKFCKEGNHLTLTFCEKHNIPHERCGKILVATNPLELTRMDHLLDRIRANRIQVQKLDHTQLKEMEPYITGLGGLFIRDTGIVDYKMITRKMAQLFQEAGGKVEVNAHVHGMSEKEDCIHLTTSLGEIKSRYVIACAGLMADRLVNMVGLKPDFQIIPFRGEYFKLPPSKQNTISHLIYPIPDPDLPFLGIHLTRMIDGSVTVGPNAVLGLKREGYGRGEIDWTDFREMIRFKGFWHVLRKNLFSGIWELKNSFLRPEYLKQVRKYCPEIKLTDLKSHPTGVRAQAVSSNGSLIHDFLFMQTNRTFHVCNAPSPAATSAIPIGNYIVDQVAEWRKTG